MRSLFFCARVAFRSAAAREYGLRSLKLSPKNRFFSLRAKTACSAGAQGIGSSSYHSIFISIYSCIGIGGNIL